MSEEPTNAQLHAQIVALQNEVRGLTEAVSGLVSVWKTGTGIFVFIRGTAKALTYLGVIGSAAAFIWKAVKTPLVGHP